jgi:MFS family permease
MESTQPKSIFANKSFTLFAASSFISMVGDQLTMIALPWLMLTLTNDPVAVGALFALLGIPRAVMILVGGALADRFHPASILQLTRALSGAGLALLAVMVWRGAVTAQHLYFFAAWLGLCSAIAIPAGQSLLPRLVDKAHFGAGNGLIMGMTQLAALVGPVASGAIIYVFQGHGRDNVGYMSVFALDAATFVLSCVSVRFLTFLGAAPAAKGPLGAALREGWRHVRADGALSSFLVYIGLISLLTSGPIMVGVPLLVKDELQGNVFQYGTFLVFMNLGALLSAPFSTTAARIPASRFIPLMLGLDMLIGLLMIVFVNTAPGLAPRAILLVVGLIAAYVQVALITRIQKRVEPRFLGRVMSYVMFAYIGLAPVSAALAGLVVKHHSARTMFEAVGAGMVAIALLFMFNRRMRRFAAEAPAPRQVPELSA